MRVLCVSGVSAIKSLENATRNEMEREERSALQERCADCEKDRSNRKKNTDLIIQLSLGCSGCECCVSFCHVQKQIRGNKVIKENYITMN